MEEKSKYEDLLEKQEISSLKDKIALPILLAVTILAAYLTFKPTADVAYIDSGYLENLKNLYALHNKRKNKPSGEFLLNKHN